MLPMFLVLLVSAVVSILIALRASHEIAKLLAIGSALVCSICGFALSPWPIQVLIFLIILRLEWLYPFNGVAPVKLPIPSSEKR